MQHTYQETTATSTTVLGTPQPTKSSAILVLTGAVVARGQRGWNRIKATAAEHRELWREVGKALLVGRKQNPSNRGFCKWYKENCFGDIPSEDRSDTMWFASYPAGNTITLGMTHPKHICQWAREQEQTVLLPADLSEIQAESTETGELD